jgi:hypothetical protein
MRTGLNMLFLSSLQPLWKARAIEFIRRFALEGFKS